MSTTAAASPLTTRKPTGKPPWPIILLAGIEKSGKSYSCAEVSASNLIGRTLWVSVGEDAPDEYGALPGARFEIVEHNGTYRGILAALTACAAEPEVDGKPNLIVLDSATRLWDLLCDEQQVEANRRAKVKAEKYKRALGDEDATITMDQWNTAKQRWAHCIDALREHTGPSIVTARLESVTVLDAKGQPTSDRTWKVKAEKSLTFDVGLTVEMPARGDTWLTGVRSLRWTSTEPRTKYPDFTVEKLWTDLGLAEKNATSIRQHTANDPEDKPGQEHDAGLLALSEKCGEKGWSRQDIAVAFVEQNGGMQLKDATGVEITTFSTWLDTNWPPKQEAEAAA